MADWLFKARYHQDPRVLGTTEAVDRVVESSAGVKLKVAYLHDTLCTSRGSMFPVREMNAEKIFAAALKK